VAVKTKVEEAKKAEAKLTGRTKRQVGTIIEAWHKVDSIEELNLSEAEVKAMIDEGLAIDEIRKAMDKKIKAFLDPIKDMLKELAKRHGFTYKEGIEGACEISPSSKTVTGTATELKQLLKKEGKSQLFDSLLTVKITDAKKFLGDDILFSGEGRFWQNLF
jgi:hypothetical protein